MRFKFSELSVNCFLRAGKERVRHDCMERWNKRMHVVAASQSDSRQRWDRRVLPHKKWLRNQQVRFKLFIEWAQRGGRPYWGKFNKKFQAVLSYEPHAFSKRIYLYSKATLKLHEPSLFLVEITLQVVIRTPDCSNGSFFVRDWIIALFYTFEREAATSCEMFRA